MESGAEDPCGSAPLREVLSGAWMHSLATELFPICRSITGEGLRATLRRIQREIPIDIHEVPSGTPVLDWTIPDEWNIGDAWIKNAAGERVVDFRRNNLHVVNYSVPVRARMSLDQLRPRLHTLPDCPDRIPYRTTYYKRDWGFCLSHAQLQKLAPGEYDVCIDSTLAPGALSYGELLIRGETDAEFLISCHCCHPSLANDNLSGIAVATALARVLSQTRTSFPLTAGVSSRERGKRPGAGRGERDGTFQKSPGRHATPGLHCSYRFLFIPGTIGAVTWLARNEATLHRIKHGLVLTCLGDSGHITWKRSRRGDAEIDRAVEQVLRDSGARHDIIDFFPCGYDERQYCSPGFNLPVGCFMRSRHGTFPEYHTSADNLEFIRPEALADSLDKLLRIVEVIESGEPERKAVKREFPASKDSRFPIHDSRSQRFINLKPKGEPQLGKYNLYEPLDGDIIPALWVLNFSDGEHSIEEIALRSGLAFDSLVKAAHLLVSRGLIKEVEHSA